MKNLFINYDEKAKNIRVKRGMDNFLDSIAASVYELVEGQEWKGVSSKLWVVCPVHGEIKISPDNFVHKGQGCSSCAKKTKDHHCKCGETDPAAFRKGRKGKCKKCENAYDAKRRPGNAERQRGYFKKWRDNNPEKMERYRKEWEEKNPDRRKEYNKNWRKKNAAHKKEYDAKYRAENPNQYANWYAENYEKKRVSDANYRASKLQAVPGWPLGDIKAKHAEAAKLTKTTGTKHHVDHIFPLQGELVRGLEVAINMQVITGTENVQKSNKFDVAEYNDLPEATPEEKEWQDFFLQEWKHHEELLKELKTASEAL